MSINHFQTLTSLISDRHAKYIERSGEIEFQCKDENDVRAIKQELKDKLNADSEDSFGFKVRVKAGNLPYKFYWGLEDFRVKIFTTDSLKIETNFSSDLAIIERSDPLKDPKTFFFDSTNKLTFIDFSETDKIYLFQNAEFYLLFLHFLKDNEHNENGSFHFVDHFSWDNGMMVFVSATKEGKLTVSFPHEIPELNINVNFFERFDRFFDSFRNNDKTKILPKFIKAELFKVLPGEAKSSRMVAWIYKLDEILDAAEQNFDIYLSDLSIQNVKKQYLETK